MLDRPQEDLGNRPWPKPKRITLADLGRTAHDRDRDAVGVRPAGPPVPGPDREGRA